MKTLKFKNTAAIFVLAISTVACSVAPINSHYESARSLRKNNMELSGSFTSYHTSDEIVQSFNRNFGCKLGYGITDNFDLKASYQRIIPSDEDFRDEIKGVNFLSLEPKFTIAPDVFALKVPVNVYFYSMEGESSSEFSLSPTLLGTIPVSDQFEVGVAASYQIFLEDDTDNFLGFSLGFGLSQDLNQWAIRPEIGYQFMPDNPDGGFLNFGIGLNFNLDLNK